jgi:hypothetical protein
VREPQRTVQRIAALVDEVPAELPVSSDATVRMQPTHSVSGIRTGSRLGGWEVRANDEWIHLMRRTDRMLVTALTLPLLVYCRYPLLAPSRRHPADLVGP